MGAKTDIARLRVAQATINRPVTVEDIVAKLDDDEAATSLDAGAVEDVLHEWVDAGIVEELPGTPARFVQVQVFAHDVERRIVGNLGRPRSVASLQAELRADPEVGTLDADDLDGMLRDLAKRGLVLSVGRHSEAETLVEAIAEHDDALDLHPESAELLVTRLAAPHRKWQLDGEQWTQTKLAHDALRVT